MEQFRSTFYYEPCLKIQLESLTKKSVQKLLIQFKMQTWYN